MRHITAAVIVLSLALPGLSKTEYAVQPVSDIPTCGRVWDLTQCELSGDEYEYTVDEGTVRRRVWSPVKRFDFYTAPGDTIWQTCAEMRAYRTLFMPGILRRLPGNEAGSAPFTLRGRIYQSEFVNGEGVSTVFPPVKGVTMSWPADTLGGVTLYHDQCIMRWSVSPDSLLQLSAVPDSLIFTTTVDNYTWMAPYEEFPRAFKRVDRVSLDGTVVESDSSAWVLNVTPSMVTGRARRALLPGGNDNDDGNSIMPVTDGNAGVTLNLGIDNITIAGNSTTAGAQATLVITDILGRLYYESAIGLTPAGVSVSIASWPRGEYLVQIIPDDGGEAVVRKITIR